MLDQDYMKQALRLARKGLGKTSPNPMVGAVIVSDGRIIGKGYHHYFGGKHAEVDAIQSAQGNITGATLYVTLEPCCHYGKTPPCVDAVIRHNMGRVVIGTADPNPQVNGKSVALLKQHGIETIVGVLEEECRSLNEAYFKHITTGMPLVTVKFAQTVDGRIAAGSGSSQWIASPQSRRLAHRLRTANDAIMVGIGTVLADDPQLTARMVRGRNPVRIILDSGLSVTPQAKVLTGQAAALTIVAATPRAAKDKLRCLREMGIEVLVTAADAAGRVDLGQLLRRLGQRGITSVLVEGGAAVITALLRLKLVDRLVIITAPRIMGKGIEAVGELNISDVNQALKLTFDRVYRRGEDIIIEARLESGWR